MSYAPQSPATTEPAMNKSVNPQVTDAVADAPVSDALPTAVNNQITDAVKQDGDETAAEMPAKD